MMDFDDFGGTPLAEETVNTGRKAAAICLPRDIGDGLLDAC